MIKPIKTSITKPSFYLIMDTVLSGNISEWLLSTGYWDDNKKWLDEETWNDA